LSYSQRHDLNKIGDKNMIETEGKCKYCGRDIKVFQKTEEEAAHYFMWLGFPLDAKRNHPNFKVVDEGDNLMAIDTDNGVWILKTDKKDFMSQPGFTSLLNAMHVRHSCCVNCGWVGEYKDLKIIDVVDKERDQCTFGCPNCNHVFHKYVLMGPEAKEGITLDKLGYELDLYRQ
jgi:hypothetical protein